MAKDVMGAKCPCCSAPLRFDPAIGKLKCDSCGNEYEEELMRQVDEAMGQSAREDEMAWEQAGAGAWQDDERKNLHAYSCPSCGAEIVVDDTTVATECVYCGSPSLMPGQMGGDYRPDAILPFKRTKKDAQDAYRKLISGKRLLPPLFAQENRIEKITGVYVPFWLFECDAEADMTFRAERKAVHTRGDYTVTDTDHFLVLRGGEIGFANVPVDGSTKFADNLMEAIEPFDHESEEHFSTAYLPGYQAERYDVDADSAKPRAGRARAGVCAGGVRCDRQRLYFRDDPIGQHPARKGQRAKRTHPCLDAQYPLEGQDVYVRHERADGQDCGKASRRFEARPLLGVGASGGLFRGAVRRCAGPFLHGGDLM